MKELNNPAYYNVSKVTSEPLKVVYDKGIELRGDVYISWSYEYIVANKEEFEKLANHINTVLQDSEVK